MFTKEKLKLAGAVGLIAFITQFLEVMGMPQFAAAVVDFHQAISRAIEKGALCPFYMQRIQGAFYYAVFFYE